MPHPQIPRFSCYPRETNKQRLLSVLRQCACIVKAKPEPVRDFGHQFVTVFSLLSHWLHSKFNMLSFEVHSGVIAWRFMDYWQVSLRYSLILFLYLRHYQLTRFQERILRMGVKEKSFSTFQWD